MESLAYLHLAFSYEDTESDELVSLSNLLARSRGPQWHRLSSKAWSYMLPLLLSLSILSSVSSALALEVGDRGPSVKNLQSDLQKAGFYKSAITQVYDRTTADAVRRFQKAAGLDVDGIAGPTTLQKLAGWRAAVKTRTATAPIATQKPPLQVSNNSKPIISTPKATVNKRRNPNILVRGDEGEAVRKLQEQLRVAGYYWGNSTGIFGPITEQSVKRFQQAYKLNVDGVVGPATAAKLPPAGVGFGGDNAPQPQAAKKNKEYLTIGDRGEAVRVIQAQLIKAGYLQGEPNGYYGAYTADAVKRFQASNYLAASGTAGPTTRGKLYRSVNTADKSEFNVLEIQRRLRGRGFYKGPLNGLMSDETKQAIKQAQEFYGVSLKDVRNGSY